jgi:diaminopimelate decarboxylase
MTSAAAIDTRFRLSETEAAELSKTFGTPLYVVDEASFRSRIREYRTAFAAAYQDSEISFASKANSTLAVIAIAASEGCLIDVASEGELRAALAAGVTPGRCHLHGNNKTEQELKFALEIGIGHVVVDHFDEIEMIHRLISVAESKCPRLVLRLAPGVDPITHAKISTGQADTKFGFNITDGSAEKAAKRCLDLGLDLYGFHCHVGSQLLDPEAQRSGGELIASFAVKLRDSLGFITRYLNIGGGLGVKYVDADEPMGVAEYNALVVSAVLAPLGGTGLTPKLGQEPGRALIAESGVTLYKVGVIKTVPAKGIGHRTYVGVDGGLSDNPRPALYGSRYTVLAFPVKPDEALKTVTVSGKHCETDKLFEDISLPESLQPGDLLQVLCTGAYNASMANNYNRYPRPASALKRLSGEFSLIQRRDTWDEMFAREAIPEGLI